MRSEDRAYICRLLDIYGGALSERHRDLADLYYNEDLSLSEISENCGITRQGVRDSVKKAVEDLYSLEASLGFAAKSERIQELAALISASGDIAEAHLLAEKITGEI
ncbi:MAG: DNA-binding protein [Clostridia bacterium]|nr:DNA-binding protein [Clostridia bacterium]